MMKLEYLKRTKSGKKWRSWFRWRGRFVDLAAASTPSDALAVSEGLGVLIRNAEYHTPDKVADAVRLGFVCPKAGEIFLRALEFGPSYRLVTKLKIHPDGEQVLIQTREQPDEASALRRENNLLRSKIERLERELNCLGVNPRGEMTLATALTRWSTEFTCRSERQRHSVLRRVGFVCAELKDKKLAEITHASVLAAVDASLKVVRSRNKQAAASSYEKSYRIRDAKRFLAWTADDLDLRSLVKVAASIHSDSIQKIARAQNGNVSTLDMAAVEKLLAAHDAGKFGSITEGTYWRALLGVLVYGGLRLGELCCLTWADVDFKQELLSVRDGEKLLKTEASNRPIKPLPAIWPLLKALQPVTGNRQLVFPALLNGKLSADGWVVEEKKKKGKLFRTRRFGWLEEEGGKLIAKRLTRCLIRLESAFNLGRQIPLRARRTARGLMLKHLAPHIVNTMMGHSGETGRAHYENALEIVLAAKYA